MPTPTLGLQGKVALVTGAAGGVGRATVALLLAHGATIVAEDHNPDVEQLAGDKVTTIVGDVADEEVARRAVSTAVDRFGHLDVLVNNAGRTLNHPILDTTVADWDAIMQTNARGCFVHTREALRTMVPRHEGAIVNVASTVSLVAMPALGAYAASKGAIAMLTKVAAVECARDGVRVNAIVAGTIDTGMLDDVVANGREMLRASGEQHPIGRAAQPGEIAEAIAFAASPRASFITGALIPVDGGYTAV